MRNLERFLILFPQGNPAASWRGIGRLNNYQELRQEHKKIKEELSTLLKEKEEDISSQQANEIREELGLINNKE